MSSAGKQEDVTEVEQTQSTCNCNCKISTAISTANATTTTTGIDSSNKALFFNISSTRISADIAQAWSNEPEQVKRTYEAQAIRENKVFESKGFPDYQYTKLSSASPTSTSAISTADGAVQNGRKSCGCKYFAKP
ncbi:hypothetical protein FBU30_000900 [Linnemannia zychae]|nr:hypothetical protein FBU30_000900 [Linnemannia zychae]